MKANAPKAQRNDSAILAKIHRPPQHTNYGAPIRVYDKEGKPCHPFETSWMAVRKGLLTDIPLFVSLSNLTSAGEFRLYILRYSRDSELAPKAFVPRILVGSFVSFDVMVQTFKRWRKLKGVKLYIDGVHKGEIA